MMMKMNLAAAPRGRPEAFTSESLGGLTGD
jgi:hypothetical protein